MTRSELVEAMARAAKRKSPAYWSEVRDAEKHWAKAMEAALSAIEQAGLVVVPNAALKWLNGEGPDENGEWFGDTQESRPVLPYWWRKVFTRMIEAGRIK